MNNLKRILWGLVLIVVGLIIGLNSFGITNINIFFEGWWTLFIIVPCFIGLFNDDDKVGNIIGLGIGLFLLLAAQNILDFSLVLKLIIPFALVMLGLSVIFKRGNKEESVPDKNNEKEYTATFSSQDINLTNENFDGADMMAIFGGVKCNLSSAKIKDKSVINATSIFGGINITIPKDIKLVVEHHSIFGGVTNKHINEEKTKKTLYINAMCLFGGIEINGEGSEDN